MATTLAAQRTAMLAELGDENGVRFPNDTQNLRVMSFASRHFAFHTGCTPANVSLTLGSGTQEYEHASGETGGIVAVRSVRLALSSSYEVNLPIVDPYGIGDASFQSGTPRAAWVRYKLGVLKFGFMPIPNATMTAKAVGIVIPVFSTTTSYNTSIPDDLALEPRYLAAAILAFGHGDYGMAGKMWGRYLEALKRAKHSIAQAGDMPYCSSFSWPAGVVG